TLSPSASAAWTCSPTSGAASQAAAGNKTALRATARRDTETRRRGHDITAERTRLRFMPEECRPPSRQLPRRNFSAPHARGPIAVIRSADGDARVSQRARTSTTPPTTRELLLEVLDHELDDRQHLGVGGPGRPRLAGELEVRLDEV